MLSGKTSSGFQFQIEEDALDDWDLLEEMTAVDDGESTRIIKVADLLLGSEQKNALKAHVRKIHGRCKASAMVEEIGEILNANNASKNS